MTTDDRPLFLLGPLAATLRWIEELANLLSGPLLVAGLGIALVDLLTDGALLTAVPALLYAWAIAQAVGVDAQLVGAWDRAKRAALRRHWWTLLGLVALGCALAYVGYVAALVFATQEANHVTEASALASLGMNATTWLWQRVGVSVFLVCLSGWTRYRSPRPQATADDERARLERELELEPLRQRVRGLRLAGVRDAATALVGRTSALVELPTVTEATPDAVDAPQHTQHDQQTASVVADDPLDVPTPAPAQRDEDDAGDQPDDQPDPPPPDPAPIRRRRSPGGGRRPIEIQAARTRTRRTALEAQAFAALDDDPDLTVDELRRILSCKKQLASELRTAWRVARREQSRQA